MRGGKACAEAQARRGLGAGQAGVEGGLGGGIAEPQISVCFNFGRPGRGSGHVHAESGIWQLSVP